MPTLIPVNMSNFRDISQPNSCDNCANITSYHTQGWSKCTAVSNSEGEGLTLCWSKMKWMVCDCWKAPYVPTEREKVLAKLSAKDKEILGIRE
jgi:hypothetical protein